MTQEEKAKAYDEAIEKAREYWETDNDNTLDIKAKGTMEYLFPELKESEGERIRKEILEYFQQFENEELRGVNISDWIAWLEKQGQKPAWSEEDEEMYQNIHECLKNGWRKLPTDLLKYESWIKSLKQRIGG